MITLGELGIGDLVTFAGGNTQYRVTHVGPKYFHVDLGDGRVSGPYSAELLVKVVKR